MNDFLLASLTFLTLLVGLFFGKSRDDSKEGFSAILPAGYIAIVIAIVVLTANINKSSGDRKKTEVAQVEARQAINRAERLQRDLDHANGELKGHTEYLKAVQRQQQELSAAQDQTREFLDQQEDAAANRRAEQGSEAASQVRTSLNRSLCFLNIPYAIYSTGLPASRISDFGTLSFMESLKSTDLRQQWRNVLFAEYSDKPAYTAMQHLLAEDVQGFDQVLRIADPNLPPTTIQKLKGWRESLDRVVTPEDIDLRSQLKLPQVLIQDRDGETEYRRMISLALEADRLLRVSASESSTEATLTCRR